MEVFILFLWQAFLIKKINFLKFIPTEKQLCSKNLEKYNYSHLSIK